MAAPVAGWFPGSHPKSAQLSLWLIASFFVMAVAWAKEPERKSEVFSLFLLPAFCVFFLHGIILYNDVSFGLASAWLLKVAVILSAATLIAERTSWRELYRILCVLTAVQVPILIMEYAGLDTFWRTASLPPQAGVVVEAGTPSGTLPTRAALSILAGFCSIWAVGWRAWFYGWVAFASTSLSGALPSIAKLVWKRGRCGHLLVLGAIGAICLIALTSSVRASSRIEAWTNAWEILRQGWLTGWGFFPVPGSFREDALGGAAQASVQFTDFHSTWVDWLTRFGLVGLLAVSPLLTWVVKRTFTSPSSWKTWTFILALAAGSVQSAEGLIVMCLLSLMWLMRLEEEWHVHTI